MDKMDAKMVQQAVLNLTHVQKLDRNALGELEKQIERIKKNAKAKDK